MFLQVALQFGAMRTKAATKQQTLAALEAQMVEHVLAMQVQAAARRTHSATVVARRSCARSSIMRTDSYDAEL